jgi:hypothetical protein
MADLAPVWNGYVELAITTRDVQDEASTTLYRYRAASLGDVTINDLMALAVIVGTNQQALENGAVTQMKLSISGGVAGTAVFEPFPSVDDTCKVTFKVADLETKLLSFATPKFSLFPTDGETLNMGDAAVITWKDSVSVQTAGGTDFQGVDEDNQQIGQALYGKRQWTRRKSGGRPA